MRGGGGKRERETDTETETDRERQTVTGRERERAYMRPDVSVEACKTGLMSVGVGAEGVVHVHGWNCISRTLSAIVTSASRPLSR